MPNNDATGRDDEPGRAMTAAIDAVRYHALDRVRALAMLLGVVYHTLLFRMFTGGPPPLTEMGQLSASKVLGDWLHSFRMPLFFLIAGFFGRMMLERYGTREFLRRRWWRIGIPLVVGMFTFGPLYILTRDLISPPPGFGPGPGRMGPPGAMMPPPGAFGGPPSAPPMPRLDEGGGPLIDAPRGLAGMPGPGIGPGPGVFPPGGPPIGPSGGPGFRPLGGGPPFGPPGGGVADKIFGPFTRYVQLNHLWFLWYLLLFVTVTPLLMGAFGLVVRSGSNRDVERLGSRLFRWGLAPVLLAVVTTPALLMTRSPFGWFLGLAPAIFRAFPDFLFHLDPDMAFYFLYFLTGWWLHRERAALPGVARAWLPNLLIGLGAFWVAISLERDSQASNATMTDGTARIVAYACYCLGSACTSFAFLGVFLRYLDTPSKTWRYLADTALWVYLIHQPLVIIGLSLARPWNLTWWSLTAVVSVSSVLVALLLYEVIVRHTPLIQVFGPSSSRRFSSSAAIDDNVGRGVSTG